MLSSGQFLAAELVDDYRLFATLFSADILARNLALAVLPPEIASLDSRTMLEFCLELGAACRADPVNLRRRDMIALAPNLLAQIVARGAALLASWPTGVRQWCNESAARVSSDPTAYKQLYLAMRKLCRTSVARPAQIALMKSEFPEFFSNFNRSFAEPGTFLLGTEACRYTSLQSKQIAALRARGLLEVREVPAPNGKRAKIQYDREDFAKLSFVLQDRIKACRAAWQIGVPLNAVEQMCYLGILDQITDPAACHLHAGLLITKTSFRSLIEGVSAGAAKGKLSPTAIPLATATRVIGGRMKPWGAILDSLLREDVEFWLGEGPSLVRRIRIDPQTISRFGGVSSDETAWPLFSFYKWLSKTEVENVLDLEPTGVNALDRDQSIQFLAAPRGSEKYGKQATNISVLQFARDVIFTPKVMRRTNTVPMRAQSLLRSASVERRSSGWDRADFESKFEVIADRAAQLLQKSLRTPLR